MATAAASNTTTTQTDEQPLKTVDAVPVTTNEGVSTEKSPPSFTDKKDGDSGETNMKTKDPVNVAEDKSTSNSEDGDSVTDTRRKFRRAERFGMPVQLSEEEKRNSRAERFGTAPSSQGSDDATKKAEELKRKARAERFGTTQLMPTEEDEKKKARLSRFGSDSNADPLEEEKKKARAIRFSGTQVNGNGKIEPKANVAGKAGGEA